MVTDWYSLHTLEFNKVLHIQTGFLRTPLSHDLLLNSTPTDDLDWLEKRWAGIRQARALLEVQKSFVFEGFSDPRPILNRLSKPGAVGDPPDFLRIWEFVRGVSALRKSLVRMNCDLGVLEEFRHRLIEQEKLATLFRETLHEDGGIRDDATPTLLRIRRRIQNQRAHIQKRLEEMCRRPHLREILQEDYFTERAGRYVLPVQSNQKRKLAGIQHGKSDSGTTSYIEPLELVESGNLLAEAIEEEVWETLAIRRMLSSAVVEQIETLQANLAAVAELDLLVALADYSLATGSSLPEVVETGTLDLRNIRHPLLLAQMEPQQVIANDLEMRDSQAGIMITGPNTGGKTVILKTVGLTCALTLAGLPPVCGRGTTVPLMSGVLADIGDDQSIEESLSTFSSHMARQCFFLEKARTVQQTSQAPCLVILDELGAGTDPAEGASLGRALIEELVSCGAWLLIATHLGELKVFAHEQEQIRCAAMLFDLETLAPTYRLELDSVGASHGLEIAERLGLPHNVVTRARTLLQSNPNQALVLLHQLAQEEKQVRDLRLQLQQTQTHISELQEQLVKELEQTRQRQQGILNKARQEARHKLEVTRRRLENVEERIQQKERRALADCEQKELDLIERQKQIDWLEDELNGRLQILLRWARKFPNFAPDRISPAQIEKLQMEKLREPNWRTILREINQEAEQIEREYQGEVVSSRDYQSVRPEWAAINTGDYLKVEGFSQPVVVQSKDERRQRLRVVAGQLETDLPWEKVLQRLPAPKGSVAEPTTSVFTCASTSDIPGEINLIGQTCEEMEPELIRFLDRAANSRRESVRIVHGHGTGALRKGVRRVLAQHPAVLKMETADRWSGGAGATVAILKQ